MICFAKNRNISGKCQLSRSTRQFIVEYWTIFIRARIIYLASSVQNGVHEEIMGCCSNHVTSIPRGGKIKRSGPFHTHVRQMGRGHIFIRNNNFEKGL